MNTQNNELGPDKHTADGKVQMNPHCFVSATHGHMRLEARVWNGKPNTAVWVCDVCNHVAKDWRA